MKIKRLVAVIGTAVMMVVSIPTATGDVVNAGTINFKDVDSSHWAEASINFAVDKGIVKGYYDEWSHIYTFLPEKSVTYEEAGVMLWRALNAAGIIPNLTEEKTNTLLATYKNPLESAKIASWAQPSLADLLERGIVDVNQLSLFVGNDMIGNSAPRKTVALWTAKALNRGLAGVYYLPYTDAAQVLEQDRPYVDMLYRQGIMRGSLQMDGTTAFLPNAVVKRSEFAAIANRVYENRAGSYDYTKDIYTYDKASQLSGLYLGNGVDVLRNGTAVSRSAGATLSTYLEGKNDFIISGIAAESDETPQVHIDTIPASSSGTIKSVKEVSNSYQNTTKVGIVVDGVVFYFIADRNTIGNSNISKGAKVKFVADGIQLVELVGFDK